jgi:S-adenosylmethionine-diacylgycerolhomoserine-N-methlytransferase
MSEVAGDAGMRMDRMYRHQRHIYDVTRKFYLLGRDGLLDALPRAPGTAICELGCGTGRNLVQLARRATATRLFGIDVSRAMLAQAARTLDRNGLADRVRLAASGISELDPAAIFGVAEFDAVYLSYVLSMVPGWQECVAAALRILRPGGMLAIVDFADQSSASALRRRALLAWLALFDVHPSAAIEAGLTAIAAAHDPHPMHHSIAGGYAYRLIFRRDAQAFQQDANCVATTCS